MEQWYRVIARKGHKGTGKFEDKQVYICSENGVSGVFDRYKDISGIKKNLALASTPFPDVFPVKNLRGLEKTIRNDDRVILPQAKNTWYFCDEIF